MNDDRLLLEMRRWLQEERVTLPDAEQASQQIASQLPAIRQRRRRWWRLPFRARMPKPPSTADTAEYQPTPIPATNGHTPTVIGRTQSMLSPAKAITAGAIVFAIGGAFLIAQPFDRQGGVVPRAEADVMPNAPVEFTASLGGEGLCSGPTSEEAIDGVEVVRGYACSDSIEASDERFTGAWSYVLSEDGYYTSEVDTVWTIVYRVENADGAWQSGPTSGIEFDDREMTVAAIFTGEDAYEGQTAIVEIGGAEKDALGASEFGLRGAILGAALPPPSDETPNE